MIHIVDGILIIGGSLCIVFAGIRIKEDEGNPIVNALMLMVGVTLIRFIPGAF